MPRRYLEAGLYTLPMAAMTIIASPHSGRLVGSRGTRLPLRIAGTAMALGLLPLTWATVTTPGWQLLAGYLVFGFGFGMVNTPITNTAVSRLPRSRAGVAAAIASTSRQVGAALGVAVIGAVASASGPTTHAAWWIMLTLSVAVLLIGHLTANPDAPHSPPRAHRLTPVALLNPISGTHVPALNRTTPSRRLRRPPATRARAARTGLSCRAGSAGGR
ncbi:MFS family permease [Actinoplanes campanulatus]|uniref:MFS family permease n=1 Tax=Actinoplanes campanulatus TaxID=113559 RepID=A0A7W5AE83_9ACTN|nr:MFS transporter [Actinoplanes campanulatus]MBB3094666.1 MFS family permease [Actinoplanes campanulatus]